MGCDQNSHGCAVNARHEILSSFFQAIRSRFQSIRLSAQRFSVSIAESTSSFVRYGPRTSINSANHQVRIGGPGNRRISSGNAVRFAMVVVPNLFASANPSLIETM